MFQTLKAQMLQNKAYKHSILTKLKKLMKLKNQIIHNLKIIKKYLLNYQKQRKIYIYPLGTNSNIF